jgi:hypothetical protein
MCRPFAATGPLSAPAWLHDPTGGESPLSTEPTTLAVLIGTYEAKVLKDWYKLFLSSERISAIFSEGRCLFMLLSMPFY